MLKLLLRKDKRNLLRPKKLPKKKMLPLLRNKPQPSKRPKKLQTKLTKSRKKSEKQKKLSKSLPIKQP
jgi:hypothetical protein